MSTTSTTTASTAARARPSRARPAERATPEAGASGDVRPPHRGRSNGQWLVDGRDPLNENEAFKQDGSPLGARERIIADYATGGFESIDPTDLHGRFRWWGLYTQRRPGIDGGRTARLDVTELEDHYFMQRIRMDGQTLSAGQMRMIGTASNEFARGTLDITAPGSLQRPVARRRSRPAQ